MCDFWLATLLELFAAIRLAQKRLSLPLSSTFFREHKEMLVVGGEEGWFCCSLPMHVSGCKRFHIVAAYSIAEFWLKFS